MKKEKVVEFLKSKDYYVDVAVDKLVTAKFPKRVLGDPPMTDYTVTYKIGPKTVLISGKDFKHKIVCQNALRRIIIKHDLILRCQILEYSEGLLSGSLDQELADLCKLSAEEIDVELKVVQVTVEAMLAATEQDKLACDMLADEEGVLDIYKSFSAIAKNGLTYDKRLIKELIS